MRYLIISIILLLLLCIGLIFYYENQDCNCVSSNPELLKQIQEKYNPKCYWPCIDGCEKEKFEYNFTDNCFNVCVKSDC
jgi:hypothetical protein